MTAPAWTLPLETIFAEAKERIDNPEFITPSVEVWFEGDTAPAWRVLVLQMPEDVNHRDASLHAARVMCSSSGADYVVLNFDTHASPHQVNPTTGKPWEPGEMQRMCDEQGYCDTGNIRDNMVTMIGRRTDGKLLQHMIPYHFHGSDNAELMFWDETTLSEWDEDTKGYMGGRVPDSLRASITSEPVSATLEKMLGKSVADMGIEHARLHQILAGVRILAATAMEHGTPMMFVSAVRTDSDEERDIVQAARADAGLFDPVADAVVGEPETASSES